MCSYSNENKAKDSSSSSVSAERSERNASQCEPASSQPVAKASGQQERDERAHGIRGRHTMLAR